MADRGHGELDLIGSVVHEAERYWRGQGVDPSARERMRDELHRHLLDAHEQGRTVREVIGGDLIAFAAGWLEVDESQTARRRALRWGGAFLLTVGVLNLATSVPLWRDISLGAYELAVAVGFLLAAGADHLRTRARPGWTRAQAWVSALVAVVVGGGGLAVLGRIQDAGPAWAHVPAWWGLLPTVLGPALMALGWQSRGRGRIRPTPGAHDPDP